MEIGSVEDSIDVVSLSDFKLEIEGSARIGADGDKDYSKLVSN
jgi:hypothetical protein